LRPTPLTRPGIAPLPRLAADARPGAGRVRAGAARITSNEPVGLYALQSVLRKVRTLNLEDSSEQRLKALSNELRTAVQDRFEQLELLPFRKS